VPHFSVDSIRPGALPGLLLMLVVCLPASCLSPEEGSADQDDYSNRPAFARLVDDPDAARSTAVISPTVTIASRTYASLSAAMIAARDGDVLQLSPGLHGGPVDVRVSIVLEPSASMGEVTIHSRSATVLRLRGDIEVVLRGITLRADGHHADGREAAVRIDGAELMLEYCHLAARANCAVEVRSGSLRLQQCSVIVEDWNRSILIEEGSEAWITDCRVENRQEAGTALEVRAASVHVSGGRLQARGAVVVAAADSNVTIEEAHLIDGGVVALAGGTLGLEDCDVVGSAREAVRCFGVATLTRSRLLQHDLGLLLSGPDARVTLTDTLLNNVDKLVAYEDGATEAQFVQEDHLPRNSKSPGGS
jgi:hypothetical protein